MLNGTNMPVNRYSNGRRKSEINLVYGNKHKGYDDYNILRISRLYSR